jgi:hypothetical protein
MDEPDGGHDTRFFGHCLLGGRPHPARAGWPGSRGTNAKRWSTGPRKITLDRWAALRFASGTPANPSHVHSSTPSRLARASIAGLK